MALTAHDIHPCYQNAHGRAIGWWLRGIGITPAEGEARPLDGGLWIQTMKGAIEITDPDGQVLARKRGNLVTIPHTLLGAQSTMLREAIAFQCRARQIPVACEWRRHS